MQNTPEMRIGVVAVSRDCFPVEHARKRLKRVVAECRRRKLPVVPCDTIVENEHDAIVAAAELTGKHVNAAAIYLGNFGPEGPLTILAETLDVPFMLCGAAEETAADLLDGRGDAFCGMLSACLNAGLRNLRPHIPDMPIGLPGEVAGMIGHFVGVSRVAVGIGRLKAIAFGPRPQDFYACNAPIKPLYDLGIEVMENSELDLFRLYQDAAGRTREINAVARDMARELGAGNKRPDKLKQLARFEVALTTFFEENLGARQFGVYANKCWPSFEPAFGFVPCYVNSRLAARGIPVACEVDIYGAVSEYMVQLATLYPATLLDVNNTVPRDLEIKNLQGADRDDLFMGFHCGNTAACCLAPGYGMKYQRIMHRLMEQPGKEPDITAGTLEGVLRPGPVTVFRLQATPDSAGLMSYIAEGHVLEADPASFGCIGVIGIRGFGRFYRHALLERQFAHHTAAGFRHGGRTLFDALRLLGVNDIATPKPPESPYASENPFGAARG